MKNIYCGQCKSKLEWKQDYAEKHQAFNDGILYYNFDKYNTETGKRQVVGWWECPKKHLWNNHDSYPVELV